MIAYPAAVSPAALTGTRKNNVKPSLHRATLIVGMALWAAAASCDRDKGIVSYQAPKEAASTEPAAIASGDHGPAVTPTPAADALPAQLTWTLPAGWRQVTVPDTSAVFKPDYAFAIAADPSLRVTISHLNMPLSPEAELANINRWAGQLQLPPLAPAELGKTISHATAGDLPLDVVDLENGGKRIVGAIFGHAIETWYVKLSGPSTAVAPQRSSFDAFLGSLRFAPASGSGDVSIGSPPPPPSNVLSGAATGAPGVSWQLPAGWTAEPGDGFRLATLHPAGNGQSLVKVSKFPGIAGGPGANVSRWRGEVGLGPVDDASADPGAPMTLGQRVWTVHDYSGPANGGRRLIVASIESGGETWFFKLSGPTSEVADAKADFEQFLSSLKFDR